MQIRPLTILVNSCDNFEDCWHPFFKLLSIYWPDCAHRIILNTEHKTFAYRGLSIRSSQVATAWSGSGRIPWSDCLLRCLEQVETEYVLYLQEDYFLNAPVDQGLLLEFIALMSEKRIPHIRLMELDRNAGHRPSRSIRCYGRFTNEPTTGSICKRGFGTKIRCARISGPAKARGNLSVGVRAGPTSGVMHSSVRASITSTRDAGLSFPTIQRELCGENGMNQP